MNQITHWIDASNIYGSTDHESELLRSMKNGLLIESDKKPGDLLPKCSENPEFDQAEPDGLESCHGCSLMGVVPEGSCFAAGTYTTYRLRKLICILAIFHKYKQAEILAKPVAKFTISSSIA